MRIGQVVDIRDPVASHPKLLTTGCDYPSTGIETAASIANDDAYLPHVAEGIETSAHNEFLCLDMAPNDVVEPMTAIIHAIALSADDTKQLHPSQTRVIWTEARTPHPHRRRMRGAGNGPSFELGAVLFAP